MSGLAKELTPKLLDFARKAGSFAVAKQQGLSHELKSDNSLVTQTDKAVSEMAKETFAEYFAQDNHFLVDEEFIGDTTPNEVFDKHEYIWVLDPIDGTVPYANKRWEYGILLGILKDGEPFLSVMYMPVFEELIWFDGEHVWQDNPSLGTPEKLTVTRQVMGHICLEVDDKQHTKIGDFKDAGMWANSPEASIGAWVHVALNRSDGYVAAGWHKIWDVAAGWVICHALNIPVIEANQGRPLTKLAADDFAANWAIKGRWVAARQEIQDDIMKVLKSRQEAA